MLSNLLNLLQVPGSQENEYVMKGEAFNTIFETIVSNSGLWAIFRRRYDGSVKVSRHSWRVSYEWFLVVEWKKYSCKIQPATFYFVTVKWNSAADLWLYARLAVWFLMQYLHKNILRANCLIFIVNDQTDTCLEFLTFWFKFCPFCLMVWYCKKQIEVSFSCICLVTNNEFRHNIVKVV